ncbi:hypothetical protein, partial [Aureimonas sp. Leaf460]|uniref:hypothetical protein n=2 Tax=unclassified Aureimonas TaxID=2615206 RepID=UPI0013DE6DB8
MANKNTARVPNLMEGGAYIQTLTVGMYAGYNEDSGVNIGVLHQVSAGIAVYNSAGVSFSLQNGVHFQKNVGVGVGVPTGVPTPVTASSFYNFMDKTTTVQVGTGVTDDLEIGLYAIANQKEIAVTNPTLPIGTISSSRLPGQGGAIPVGSELNALDVISELRAQANLNFGQMYYTPSAQDISISNNKKYTGNASWGQNSPPGIGPNSPVSYSGSSRVSNSAPPGIGPNASVTRSTGSGASARVSNSAPPGIGPNASVTRSTGSGA